MVSPGPRYWCRIAAGSDSSIRGTKGECNEACLRSGTGTADRRDGGADLRAGIPRRHLGERHRQLEGTAAGRDGQRHQRRHQRGSHYDTNGDGEYNILFLTPGTYTLTVELSGFKKMVREGLEVRIGDKLAVDATLDVGRVEETVSVTAESPLLETRSGSAGQVIGEKAISLMPLSDGNPFALARLVPGVAYNGDLKFSRPFDNGGTSAINADGSTGGNEFTLDGSPNM